MTDDTQPNTALVTFYPQIWRGDRAITAHEQIEKFTVPLEDALDDDGEMLEDDSYGSDQLRCHDNAPKMAREWDGPFYVTVDGQ
jgi:hypothetical protein